MTAKVEEHPGPDRYLTDAGRVSISIKHRPDLHDDAGTLMVEGAWVAKALGWYRTTNTVAESPDRDALVAHCLETYPGCKIEIED